MNENSTQSPSDSDNTSSQAHTHNYKDYFCVDCGRVDKSAIKVNLPSESKIYNAHYDNLSLGWIGGSVDATVKYQIKDITYDIYKIEPAALRLDVKFKVVPLGTIQSIKNNEPKELDDVAFYYDWANLIGDDGLLNIATNSYDDTETNSITARKDKDNEVTLRFEYIKAGTYTLGFLEGDYGDYLNELSDDLFEYAEKYY